jgi:endonuclease/exonuclease/phosphatase family metal-dependent hydrolase
LFFPNNNVIYADIKKGKDIIRVYNMHLQSIKISPDVDEINDNLEVINKSKSQIKGLVRLLHSSNSKLRSFKEHESRCEYPVIICGDMNNSAYSMFTKY